MLVQIAAPLLRAAEQPKASCDTLEKPEPQQPQRISPENRNFGRRRSQTGTSVFFDFSAPWRWRTRFHSASSRIRSSGTSVMTQSACGFNREARLPVAGSLT